MHEFFPSTYKHANSGFHQLPSSHRERVCMETCQIHFLGNTCQYDAEHALGHRGLFLFRTYSSLALSSHIQVVGLHRFILQELHLEMLI